MFPIAEKFATLCRIEKAIAQLEAVPFWKLTVSDPLSVVNLRQIYAAACSSAVSFDPLVTTLSNSKTFDDSDAPVRPTGSALR